MIATGILGAIIAVLLVERAVNLRQWAAERRNLINAVLARHPGEYVAMNAADKVNERRDRPRHLVDPDTGEYPVQISG